MVPAQPLKLLGEIERSENREIGRIDRLAAGANCFDLFVNRRGQRSRPFVTAITGNDELLAHDFDVDTFHGLTEIQAIKTSQNTFDAQLNLIAGVFMLPQPYAGLIESLLTFSQPLRQLFIFSLQLLDSIQRSLYPLVQLPKDVSLHVLIISTLTLIFD